MLAFIIAPFIIALFIVILIRTTKYLRVYHVRGLKLIEFILGLILFSGFSLAIIAFLLPSNFILKRLLTKIAYYWVGVLLYAVVALAISLLVRHTIWLFMKNKGYSILAARNNTIVFVLLFTTIMSISGIYNAHKLRITNYEIDINKKSFVDNLNVVLIADLHIGYNDGLKEMKDMVDSINSLNPDIVILAGDIFDNEYEAIENPNEMVKVLNSIKTKYGKYATYGNHDIQEKLLLGFGFEWSKEAKSKVKADERMNKFVEDAGFEFLYDSYALIGDSIYIYGRPDASKINFGNTSRLSPNEITKKMDKDKTIICVDHQPGELEELATAGVDLDLSGHTHNGQFWPGTLTIKLFWKNAYGLMRIGNMVSIVTSGVGLYGFNMRTGCFPEVVNIKINFNNQ